MAKGNISGDGAVEVDDGGTPRQIRGAALVDDLGNHQGTASTPLTTAVGDGANLDAFSRMRVGLPQLRFSGIFDYDKRPLLWAESLTGTGTATHLPDEYSVAMAVAASGDIVVRQTKEYFVYRAAQSQLILATFVMDTADDNVTEEVGYGDAEDGVFLRRVGSVVSVVLRSFTSGSAVDTVVAQSSWNLDALDGTGASGITLDLTKTQILVIDLQWLGVGRVRFGFDIGGVIVYVHQFLNANTTQTAVYMRRAKLPIRYRIEATGTPGATRTMKQVCATVIREGGSDEPSVQHEGRSNASINVATAWETVLGLRVKSANIRATLRLLSVTMFNEDTDWVEYAVVLNPSYSGTPSWEDIDTDNVGEISRFNAAISVNGAGDPGVGHTYPVGGFIPGGTNQQEASPVSTTLGDTVPIVADIAGAADEVWLVARASTGTANVRGLIAWTEER